MPLPLETWDLLLPLRHTIGDGTDRRAGTASGPEWQNDRARRPDFVGRHLFEMRVLDLVNTRLAQVVMVDHER